MHFKLPKVPRDTCSQRRRTLCSLAGAASLLALLNRPLKADGFERDSQSSAATKSLALREIPTHLLNKEAQAKVAGVVNSCSYFRRMPEKSIECDSQIFEELVRYPEILVGMWDLMGVTRVEVQRTAPYVFHGDDNAGTRCVTELLMGNDNTHIYYATGDYTGKLVPRTLEGRSVCVIHSQSSKSADGRDLITAHMDVFLKLDNIGADIVVRTLSPLVGSTADQNYVESLKFVSQLSRASVQNPGGVKSLVDRMAKVQPPVKERFVNAVYLAYDRAENIAFADNDPADIETIGPQTARTATPHTDR